MTKIAAIIGGVLLMAGVAYAGTSTLLAQATGPTLGTTVQPAAQTSTTRQDDRSRESEVRSRENELRGRENEAEDLRGPCDEAEHANDPRCTGVAVAPRGDDDVADDRGDDGNRGPGANSGPSERSGHEVGDDSSGHGGGGDSSGHGDGGGDGDGGGHSGHGGGGDD
jgi:uncharacterized membrane protein YgcG